MPQHPGNDYYVDTLNGSIQRGYMAATIRFLGHPMAGPFDWARAVQVANQSNLNKDVIKPAKAVAGAAETVGSFLGKLSNPHTWLRVAEVAVGAILIGVALNAILKQSTGVDVAGSAVKVAKAVK
jgi:hypothetical protein